MNIRRILVSIFIVGIVVYCAAYAFLPKRSSAMYHYLEHHREFDHSLETVIFVPAGYLESVFVRLFPVAYTPEIECPQTVVVESSGFAFRFEAGPKLRPVDAVIPSDVDILDHVLRTTLYRHGTTKWSDGLGRICKYWDCRLDAAEDFLAPNYPRPWTISKVLTWYKQAANEETCVHLAHVLGASRDPRAALALAEAMSSSMYFKLRLTAASILESQFVPHACSRGGDTESDFRDSEEWLAANKVRLQKECEKL
jgi:hypothetical protein